MNVKGLKISDILNMDWSDLNAFTAKELKQLTTAVSDGSLAATIAIKEMK